MAEEESINFGSDIDPETGNFVVKPEQEFSENRMERFRAQIIELLQSDIESVVTSLSSITMETEEVFEIELELDISELGDIEVALSDDELKKLRGMLESPEAKAVYTENQVEYFGARFGLDHLAQNQLVLTVALKSHFEPGELSGEFLNMQFSNTCHYCKEAGEEDPTVILKEEVPTSLAGKWKKTKGKNQSMGKEYRDWDYGEVECPKCAERGTPSKVFLFHREYR